MPKQRKNIFKFVIYVILLILTTFSISFFGPVDSNITIFNNKVISIISLKGVITCFQIFISVCFVIDYRKKGFQISGFFLLFNLLLILLAMLKQGTLSPLPGIMIDITGFFIIYIVNKYLKKIDHHEKIIREYAYVDALTGLPNDHALDEYLEALVARKKAENGTFAVVNCELDDFDSVNDAIGYEAGNKVICTIVQRWKCLVAPNDFLAKKDGLRFVLLVEEYSSEKQLLQHIAEFAEALREKITVEGKEIYLSGGFGIAYFPQVTNCQDLLLSSDIAMRYAKKSGNIKIRVFESSMQKSAEDEVAINSLIRRALETNAFQLVFQPQFTSVEKRLRGFETLLRLKNSDGVPVSPAVFIPIAEKNGHIIEIDRWVLKHALQQFAPIIHKGGSDILISVNISAQHVLEDFFIDDVRQALAETGFSPQNLELEITESLMIQSLSEAVKILNQLKEMGIKIALDDFGTGYTSLNYLRKLPVNLLKIDKSFVDEITDSVNGKEYIAAIISIGHLLNLSVVSEGVEEDAQLEILKELKCDYIQGYLWGKPMDFDSALQLIP